MSKSFCTTGKKHTRMHFKWIGSVFYILLCTNERKISLPNWITGRLSARIDQITSILWFAVERPIPTLPNSDMLSLWPDLRAIYIACIVLNIYKSRFFKIECVLLKFSGSWESVCVFLEMTLSLLIGQIQAGVSGLFWFIHITQLERNSVYIILIFQWGYIS